MNSKVFNKDSCSRLEANWNNLELSDIALNSDWFVNPEWSNLLGKNIIITLPTKLNLKLLTKRNKVYSRYRLSLEGEDLNYELIPYDINFKSNVNSNYSRRILNKYLLTSENFNITDEDKFLLGTEPMTNDNINTIGYILLKSNQNL